MKEVTIGISNSPLTKGDIALNNKNFYSDICTLAGIETMAEAASLLYNKGYETYKSAETISNRFRSPNTGTDFFWKLLDASGCHVEVCKKDEPSREELKENISILKNELELIRAVDHDADLLSQIKVLGQTVEKMKEFQKTFSEIDLNYPSHIAKDYL
ncbi:MAG TPA: hypothetical protein ENK66_08600 [Arcobacter sp.]|nr:hypothetical protein [Arcobacter sp.]